MVSLVSVRAAAIWAAGPAPVPRPTAGSILLWWRVSPLVVVPLALAVLLYLGGVRRLARSSHPWPLHRTAFFFSGMSAIYLSLQSSVERYATALFSIHVAQHMLLTMIAPPLVALEAPITLALRASGRPARRTILRVVRSRPIQIIGHPLVAWALFTLSLYALYFSPLYALSLRHEWLHDVVHLHFLTVGFLFWWPVVGIDPSRWRLSYPARLLYVALMVPFHALLGVAILSTNQLLEPAGALAPRPWGPSALGDQHSGGAILWAAGDILALAAMGSVLMAWMLNERRTAAREDRRLDRSGAPGAVSWTGRPSE